ncbi:hypothetical protein BKH41_09180 [Helicobacter sp. 12S02232-10]|uniref:McrC family protein n=1 Tax=Helicobacter sp. 12S02232-10 TaxID=1476197 RepID=UPI000BA6716A|nr:McrC family protein [Helicobacter sp. 12S02232-10]PAF46473.1 hypothetical protein BKH41_09180 [Helicobacter sp. 12S02232-10]
MNKNNKYILQITEWQKFGIDDIDVGNKNKAQKIFDELKDFALYEENQNFLIPVKGGRYLKAVNYVGLIQTKSGFSLEILPKIAQNDQENKEKSKELLLQMLKTLKNSPFKTTRISSLKTTQSSLLEIFVQMFLDELMRLIKKGLKSSYECVEENRFCFKGKIIFNEHIKHNLIHQERFWTQSDEHIPNIPQNRLIVSVLDFLSKISLSTDLESLLRRCRFIFDSIPLSKNIERDFGCCFQNRSLRHYEAILAYCRVFLKKQVFTLYAGNNVSMALLFDMNKLFESYVAHCFKQVSPKDWTIVSQDRSKYLLEDKWCALRPDIVATNGEKIIIFDTKWKLLSDQIQKNISVADIYQMWAYASRYKSKKAVLIYPKVSETQGIYKKFEHDFKNNDFEPFLDIIFIDLREKMLENQLKEHLKL